MLRLRLSKTGKKNERNFRIIASEARAKPKTGRVSEVLGYYNPAQKKVNLKKERILYWLSKGAKPSATLRNILVSSGVIAGPKARKGKAKKKEEAAKEVKTEAGKSLI